ncbi:hypothetical protein OQZ33_17125 [Pedobacter sp. MC2016-05]|uniref:hypothetical protein n=1 Tax=Pedobacter sp. MC2016-05 TaxID=2994474 RepID=UPI0022477F05|nr:hypothetical protein [Pedobacter sp. MC2016-05]MCX2476059.1 hypothetical protein [Pedobacter sp. MC2016-05]
MNYNGLDEKFFEVYISYLLYHVGLKPQPGQSYISEAGNEKAMDLLIHIGEQSYNVEITKYYDGFQDELLSLSKHIIRLMVSLQKKKNIQRYEMFSGYITFKSRNIEAVKENKNKFQNRVYTFLHGFRNAKGSSIHIQSKYTGDCYDFELESAFSDNFDKVYPNVLKPFLASICFKISYNVSSGMMQCRESILYQPTTAEIQQRLEEKVREKLMQHRDCPYRLLIVIGIEQMFGTYDKNPAMAAQMDRIDEQAINKLIHQKAVLMLIFKKLEPNGLTISKIFATDTADWSLVEYLKKVDPKVYYHKREDLDLN